MILCLLEGNNVNKINKTKNKIIRQTKPDTFTSLLFHGDRLPSVSGFLFAYFIRGDGIYGKTK